MNKFLKTKSNGTVVNRSDHHCFDFLALAFCTLLVCTSASRLTWLPHATTILLLYPLSTTKMPRSKAKPTQYAQKGRPQDNDNEGDSSEEQSVQNDITDEEATSILHRPWPNDNRSSLFAQASLLGLLSVIVVTLIAGSFLAVLSSHGRASYSTTHRADHPTKGGAPANLLGLYHVKVATHSNRMLTSSTQPSAADTFFLRYYTMPNSNDNNNNEWALSASMDSNQSDTSLLQVLTQELADATRHDILEPLVERWKGRLDAVKRRITGVHDESSNAETAVAMQKAIPPHSIFGIYPSTDHIGVIDEEAYKRQHPPKTKMLAQTLETATSLPKRVIRRSRRGESVCPTSLFCYYRLPATMESSNDNHCAR